MGHETPIFLVVGSPIEKQASPFSYRFHRWCSLVDDKLNIAEVDDEIRGIIARNWPSMLSKFPPDEH